MRCQPGLGGGKLLLPELPGRPSEELGATWQFSKTAILPARSADLQQQCHLGICQECTFPLSCSMSTASREEVTSLHIATGNLRPSEAAFTQTHPSVSGIVEVGHACCPPFPPHPRLGAVGEEERGCPCGAERR